MLRPQRPFRRLAASTLIPFQPPGLFNNRFQFLNGEIMQTLIKTKLPEIKTSLPGPKAKEFLEKDKMYISPSYTRSYPLVMKRGYGALIEDVDGNTFLDFNAGVAVAALGHAQPEIAEVIAAQAREFI